MWIHSLRDLASPASRELARLFELSALHVQPGYRRFTSEAVQDNGIISVFDHRVREKPEYFLKISACALVRLMETVEHPGDIIYFPTSAEIRYINILGVYENYGMKKGFQPVSVSESGIPACFRKMYSIVTFLFALELAFFQDDVRQREILSVYQHISNRINQKDRFSKKTALPISSRRLVLKGVARTINLDTLKPVT